MKTSQLHLLLFFIVFSFFACQTTETPNAKIDREALVKRHIVQVDKFDSLSSLSVGNGEFAFTVDATGLQTFPELYAKGVPLGTQSEWGWHRFPDTGDYQFSEILEEYDFHGRKVSYDVQWREPKRKQEATNYLRQNPHRLHLGIVGLELTKEDGSLVEVADISNIQQELDMWTGTIKSTFEVSGSSVEVITYCHQDKDMISAQISSSLIEAGKLSVKWRFPFPSGGHVDDACNWDAVDQHTSTLASSHSNSASIARKLDDTDYMVNIAWEGEAELKEKSQHYFVLTPDANQSSFSFSCQFSESEPASALPTFSETHENNQQAWETFWQSGGAVDFSGSTAPEAAELERRIVLSQYLTRIQCAGNYPPQETGLTCNSWYGKFHLEMHWWHGVHYALWNRIDLLEKSLGWYETVADVARETAQRQGFEGLRWTKMTDPSGHDSPSNVGSFLIWQQPHYIYFAELVYRHRPEQATLEKYSDLLFETADFMASYAWYEEAEDRYVLGPILIPAQESLPFRETVNPPFELTYWYWGISTAQKWRERMGMERKPEWDDVLKKLSPLAQKDGLYLAAESAQDSYSNDRYMQDHPIVLGALGMLPKTPLLEEEIMRTTFDHVWENWHWDHTWGWDFPFTAMTATRLGMPEKAIDALMMPISTNTYLVNGHNYQDTRLRLYLPGNGALLTAIAMMCAGYEGSTEEMPGIPKTDAWKVKWEGLEPMF